MMAAKPDQRSYLLIKGEFKPAEANEVLMKLINDKISFHQTHNWSRRELGESDAAGRERIEQLTRTKAELAELLKAADAAGQRLAINCNIEINLLQS
jgi:hypothetical protein